MFLTEVARSYIYFLRVYPLSTQAITSSCLMGFGSILSQNLVEKQKFHLFRTIKFSILGLVFVGPCYHYWYTFLERVIKGSTVSRPLKMLITDMVFMSPFMTFSVITFVGFTRSWSVEEAKFSVITNFPPAIIANFKIWPIVQLVNFFFVPSLYRVFVVNFVALFWSTYLSYVSRMKVTRK